MVERRPLWTFATHAVLGLGLLGVAFPLYVTLVASTHSAQELLGHPPGSATASSRTTASPDRGGRGRGAPRSSGCS